MSISHRMTGLSVCVTLILIAAPAMAVDGVVEINQARAAIGGVSSNDTPGFPVSITESGSYRLTSNLTIDEKLNAIAIYASNVTLDLNGFAIIGPVKCTAGTSTCTPAGVVSAYGVFASSAADYLTIKNGIITGTGGSGVYCGNSEVCVVEHVTITDNYSYGIITGNNGHVRNCDIHTNRSSGISAGASTIIENNIINLNGSRGLLVRGDGVIATSNVFYRNATTEIDMSSKITAIGGNSFTAAVSGNWFDNNSKMTEISSNLFVDASSPYTNCTGL